MLNIFIIFFLFPFKLSLILVEVVEQIDHFDLSSSFAWCYFSLEQIIQLRKVIYVLYIFLE